MPANSQLLIEFITKKRDSYQRLFDLVREARRIHAPRLKIRSVSVVSSSKLHPRGWKVKGAIERKAALHYAVGPSLGSYPIPVI